MEKNQRAGNISLKLIQHLLEDLKTKKVSGSMKKKISGEFFSGELEN